MAKRARDVDKRQRKNRAPAAQQTLADALEASGFGNVTSLDFGRHSAETGFDENLFARVTAEIVAQPFGLASPQDESPEQNKNRFLNSTTGLLVPKGAATATAVRAPRAEAGLRADAIAARDEDADELRNLRRELASLRETLAAREGQLAKAESDHDEAREEWRREREDAERAWKNAEAARLAEAQSRWREESADRSSQSGTERDESADELRNLRGELASLRETLAEREAALTKAESDREQAREEWQRGREDAERAWKDAEAARLAEAEAAWREQSAASLEDWRARAEAERGESEGELRNLRGELTALRATLAQREAQLAKAATDHDEAQERLRQESRAAVSKAEQDFRAAESARFSAAETKWREQFATAMADFRDKAHAARNQAEGIIRGLRDELTAMRSTLADREAQLAKSEQAWKASEAERLAAAEAAWQKQSAKALAELREKAESDIRAVRDELSALRNTLEENESALAEAVSKSEQARERGRLEVEAAVAKAKAREAGEAERLAAAEAKWREQSASALNEATARYQTAEGMLTQLRMQANRDRVDAVGGSIKPAKSARIGAKPARREAEPAPIQLPSRDEHRASVGKIEIGPRRVQVEPPTRKKRGALRDIVVAGSLAAAAIVFYPRIEPFVPEPYRSNIASVIGTYAPAQTFSAQGPASVVSDANLRVGPSTTARVIVTLSSGQRVAMIERRGDWTLVMVENGDPDAQPQRGWVFASLLRAEPGEAEDDDDDADTSDEAE